MKKEEQDFGTFIGNINNYSTGRELAVETIAKGIADSDQKLPNLQYNADEYGIIQPTINRYDLAELIKHNETHAACLKVKQYCTTGKGYKFLTDNSLPKMKKIIKWAKNPSGRFGYTLNNLINDIAYDYFVYEQFFLETVSSSRNPKLYRADPKTMYVAPKLNRYGMPLVNQIDKYVQLVNNQRGFHAATEFKPYGGKSENRILHGIIQGGSMSQTDPYYGTPSYLPVIKYIVENSYINEFNTKFFKQGAKPSFAMFITGHELTEKQTEEFKKTMNTSMIGLENAHKILTLSFPESDSKINFVPLNKGFDGSFMELRLSNRDLITLGHVVAPNLIGISSAKSLGGGSDDIGAMKKFLEIVISTPQKTIEQIINMFIEEEFGIDPQFKLNSIDITNAKDDAIVDQIYFDMMDEMGNRVKDVQEIIAERGFNKKTIKTKLIDETKLTIEEKEKYGILNQAKDEPADFRDDTISTASDNGSPKMGNKSLEMDENDYDNLNSQTKM
jgi:hypothetical protein